MQMFYLIFDCSNIKYGIKLLHSLLKLSILNRINRNISNKKPLNADTNIYETKCPNR